LNHQDAKAWRNTKARRQGGKEATRQQGRDKGKMATGKKAKALLVTLCLPAPMVQKKKKSKNKTSAKPSASLILCGKKKQPLYMTALK
jgi:hypothetical protein